MKIRSLGLALAVSGLLVACGGGLLALLPFVGAIGGSWVGGTPDANGWQPADPSQSLNFLEPPFPADLYSAPDAEFPAILSGLATNCGGANDTPQLVARFNGADFSLTRPNASTPCATGIFRDEITIRLNTGGNGSLLRNLRPFFPFFEEGVWVNINNTNQKLRFRNDLATVNGVSTQSGCEFVGATQTGTFVATFRLGDNDLGTLLAIDSIAFSRGGGAESLTAGKMSGISGVVIGSGTGDVSLQRRNETLTCA
ncbi:MAG: hypothetical protein ACRC2B_06275 [Rubrivivax sp.]